MPNSSAGDPTWPRLLSSMVLLVCEKFNSNDDRTEQVQLLESKDAPALAESGTEGENTEPEHAKPSSDSKDLTRARLLKVESMSKCKESETDRRGPD